MIRLKRGDVKMLGHLADRASLTTERKAVAIMNVVGQRTVEYLRSLTDEMRPPARGKSSERRAHPGHWADVTGALANAYSYQVVPVRGGAQLTLGNSMQYAVYLERREGFFVLSGVAGKGGPVIQAIREAVKIVDPSIQIRG